jgi:hypothetical protein
MVKRTAPARSSSVLATGAFDNGALHLEALGAQLLAVADGLVRVLEEQRRAAKGIGEQRNDGNGDHRPRANPRANGDGEPVRPRAV